MLITGGRFFGKVCMIVLTLSLFAGFVAPAATIRVDWSPPSSPDLAGYRLRYSTDGETYPYGVYIANPDAASHTVTDLNVGTTYYFKMQSVDTSGLRSLYSSPVSCTALPWSSEANPPVVPSTVSLDQPVFPFTWDVSEFGGVAGAGLEVSLVNQYFANPNGTEWDPGHRCFKRVLYSPASTTTVTALNFQGPGLYQIRVVALDEFGTIICRFSDSVPIEVISGAPAMPELIITGPGPGRNNPPLARLFDPTVSLAEPLLEFAAYGGERYGVNVAVGDVTGNGQLAIVTGPGPGEGLGPHVRGFDDQGNPLPGLSFLAYGVNRFGARVALGDIDGDGIDEIVTGPGPGEDFGFGPNVKTFDYDGGSSVVTGISYMAYGFPKYGVNVACGDIDGDGIDEIVTGPGPGMGYRARVRGWNMDGGGVVAMEGVNVLAYSTNNYGVNVACGDIDGDGIDEIITGPGPGQGYSAHVRGWAVSVDPYGVGTTDQIPGGSFVAYDSFHYGVVVACGDIDGDCVDEIITAPGPGPGAGYTATIRGWNYVDGTVEQSGLDFLAYDEDYIFGASVAAGRGIN